MASLFVLGPGRGPDAATDCHGHHWLAALFLAAFAGTLGLTACAPLPGLRSHPPLDSPSAWQAALPCYETAAAEGPEDPSRWAELSLAYYFAGRYADADSVAARALALEPRHGLAHYARALLLEQEGAYVAADSIYRRSEEYTDVNGDLRRVLTTRHQIVSQQIIREQLRTELADAAERRPELDAQALIVRRFQPLGGTHRDSVLAVGVTHFLITAFAQIESLTVIDQTRQRLLEEEIARSQEAAFAADSRLAARTIGAGLSLAGRTGESIAEASDVAVQYDLDDLMIARDVPAYRGTPRLVEFFAPRRYLLEDLGRHVLSLATERLHLPVSGRVQRHLSRPPTGSYEAFMAFAEGLFWEHEGHYGRAYGHFREALQIDPGFDWAITGAERVAGAGERGEAVAPRQAQPSLSEEAYAEQAAEVAGEWVDELPGVRPEDPEPLPPQSRGARVTIIVWPH